MKITATTTSQKSAAPTFSNRRLSNTDRSHSFTTGLRRVASTLPRVFTSSARALPRHVLLFAIAATILKLEAVPVNVKDFGAGNGGDDTASIQKALDAVASTAGGTVLFPCGTYNVDASTPLVPRSFTILTGESVNCTTLKNNNRGGGSIFLINYDSSHGSKILFEHMMIMGRNQPNTVGITIGGSTNPKAEHITLNDVKVTQCDPGLLIHDAWDINLTRTYVEFNLGNGITINAPNALAGMYIYGSRIGNNGGHGIENLGNVITELDIMHSELSYNGGTELVMGNSRDSNIRDTWLEESVAPQNGIDVTACQRCTIDGVHSDHAEIGVYSSIPVNQLTVANSTFTNATMSVSLPAGSTNIGVYQNRGDSGVSIGQSALSAYFGNSWPATK